MPRSRRGDWIQVFLVAFFFLLLFIGLSLLFLEKGSLETTRPELNQDLAQHNADLALVTLLRQPVDIDITGDGSPETITLAALIALDNRSHDPIVRRMVNTSLDHAIFVCTITTPGTTIVVRRIWNANILKMLWQYLGRYQASLIVPSVAFIEQFESQDAINTRLLVTKLPTSSIELPGGATVTLRYADAQTLQWILTASDKKALAAESQRILAEAHE